MRIRATGDERNLNHSNTDASTQPQPQTPKPHSTHAIRRSSFSNTAHSTQHTRASTQHAASILDTPRHGHARHVRPSTRDMSGLLTLLPAAYSPSLAALRGRTPTDRSSAPPEYDLPPADTDTDHPHSHSHSLPLPPTLLPPPPPPPPRPLATLQQPQQSLLHRCRKRSRRRGWRRERVRGGGGR